MFRGTKPKTRLESDAPIVILSPHLDDAVLNCWSVITSGAPVQVVNVFAQVPPPGPVSEWDRICGARDSTTHFRARLTEDRAVLEPLVGAPLNLSLLEQQYRADSSKTLATIERELDRVLPAASAVYSPAALGEAHVDHSLVQTVARKLARADIAVWLYADVPYAIPYGWPKWVTEGVGVPRSGAAAFWRRSLARLRRIGVSGETRVVRLDEAAAGRKLNAMQMYETQFTALDCRGLLSDPTTHRYELFWSLGA
jgi:LmbE family N-acetylglucosaminyl deacetylase